MESWKTDEMPMDTMPSGQNTYPKVVQNAPSWRKGIRKSHGVLSSLLGGLALFVSGCDLFRDLLCFQSYGLRSVLP